MLDRDSAGLEMWAQGFDDRGQDTLRVGPNRAREKRERYHFTRLTLGRNILAEMLSSSPWHTSGSTK